MRRFIKSPLGIGIITTLLGFMLTILYDTIRGKHILSTILNILKIIWRSIIGFFNFNLRLWWVLLGIVIIIFVLWIIAEIYSVINGEPIFKKYTKDTIRGWKWEWHWQKNYYGQYEIKDLHLICDVCETPLKRDYGGSLYCVRCGKEYFGVGLPDEEDVKLYIIDSAKRGIMPNVNDSK